MLAGETYQLLCIKVTYPENRGEGGSVEEHTVLPAGRAVSVKGEYKTAKSLYTGDAFSVSVKDGYTTVTLPEITGYEIVCLN